MKGMIVPNTPPPNMTPDELERWHYANGDTVLAEIYRQIAEGVDALKAFYDLR